MRGGVGIISLRNAIGVCDLICIMEDKVKGVAPCPKKDKTQGAYASQASHVSYLTRHHNPFIK